MKIHWEQFIRRRSLGWSGLIEDESYITTSAFSNVGDDIILLGRLRGDINGSEYLKGILRHDGRQAPYFDIEEEKAAAGVLLGANS